MTGGKSNPDFDSDFNSDPNLKPNSQINPASHSEPQHSEQTVTPDAVSAASSPACDRVRPELKAYLDGQTGWWQRRRVRAHAAQCPLCREEMESMREFSDNLRSADAETLDPALRAKILAAVPHTPPVSANARPARPKAQRPLLWAGAAAASAALASAALYPALTARNTPVVEATISPSAAQQAMKTAAAGAMPPSAPMETNGGCRDGRRKRGRAFPLCCKCGQAEFCGGHARRAAFCCCAARRSKILCRQAG